MKITQRLISFVLTLSLFSSISVGAWADTLTLPASIKVIGEEAFAHDSSLDKVVIPEGVETIETRAFAESSVSEVNLPRSLRYIAEDAFWPNSPAVDVEEGSYAYRWAAGHELVTALAFNDSTAYDHHDVRAAFSDDERIGLYHIEWVRNYEIANYDALMEKYGGRPTWSAAFTGESYGATLRCVEWNGQDPQHIDLLIDHEPEFPCTLHYEIICSWGGESITGLGTIEYRNVKLPTGMELPNEFRGLRVGETFTFHPQILPANYSFGDFILSEFWTDAECDCWNEWENGDNVCYIRPREAGIISGTFVKRYENVQMRKNVVLYVEDENGNVPAQVPKLGEEYRFDMAIGLRNEQGFEVYMTNRTLGVSFSNMDMLRDLYGDSCSWSFETTEGKPLDLSWEDDGDYFEFIVNNIDNMSENMQSTVRATLSWGETSASTLFRFHFGRLKLPEEIRFEQNIRMTAGQTYRARVEILPESWGEKYFLYYDIGDNGQMEKWNIEPEAYYLRAAHAGYYLAQPHIHAWDNVFIYGDPIIIPVYERDGSIGDIAPLFFNKPGEPFETDIMLGRFAEPGMEGWVSRKVLFGWVLDNAEQLYEAYGADPEIVWGYERTGGLDIRLELNPWKASHVVGDACDIALREMPTMPGVMDFILYCEWNGHRGEMPCRVYVNEKPARLPQANTFPDEITVTVGETVYVSGHYPDGSYDVGENFYWIAADDAYVRIERNPEEKSSLRITGIREGTISALAKVGVSGNAFAQKPVIIHVLQEESYFEDLSESGLFTQLDEAWIELPKIPELGEEYKTIVDEFNEEQSQYLSYAQEYNKNVSALKAAYDELEKLVDSYTVDYSEDGFFIDAGEISLTIEREVFTPLENECEIVSATAMEADGIQFEVRDERGESFYILVKNQQIIISSKSADIMSNSQNAVFLSGENDNPTNQNEDFWKTASDIISVSDNIVTIITNGLSTLGNMMINSIDDKIIDKQTRIVELESQLSTINDPEARKLFQDVIDKHKHVLQSRNNVKAALKTAGKVGREVLDWLPGVSSAADIYSVYDARKKIVDLENLKKHNHPNAQELDEDSLKVIQNTNLCIAQAENGYWVSALTNAGSAIVGAFGISSKIQKIDRAKDFLQKTHMILCEKLEPNKWPDFFDAGVGLGVFGIEAFVLDNIYKKAFELDRLLHYMMGGVVVDTVTGKPIEGVAVTCYVDGFNPKEHPTSQDGTFHLEPLGSRLTLTFEKEGYKAKEKLPFPKDGTDLVVDYELFERITLDPKPSTVAGNVRTHNGLNPIEGAKIICGDQVVYSDEKGDYNFEIDPGTYNIVCSKPGYIRKTYQIEVKPHEITDRVFLLDKGSEIWTREDLEAVADDPSGDYVLCADISLSSAPWTPLPWFSGTLDGCGFSIYGMMINESFDGNLGLFGGLNGARLFDLTVSGTIDVPADQSFTNVGFLCGNSLNASVDNCMSYGNISIREGSGMVFAGGILGLGKAELTKCASSADISAKTRNNANISGLVGKLNEGTISGSDYLGSLSLEQVGSNSSAYFTAVGTAYTDNVVFHDCVVSGTIEVTTNDAFAHACGLGNTVSGANRANVTATAKNAGAMASGCELGSGVTNTGTVTAVCEGSGSAYAVGITGRISSAAECSNTGAVSAHCAVGDSLAVGVSDCANSENEGSVSSVCGRGKAIGQGMTNCDKSHNSGDVTVSYLGINGTAGELSAHGLSDCYDSVNDGNVIATIENAYVQPTAAGSAGGTGCINNGRVECQSASGPAVAYGVSGYHSQNHGPVKAESTGNAAPAKEVYAVASGISNGSDCYNDAIVSAHATLGAARAYGYDDRSSSSQSNANVQAVTDYYTSVPIDGRDYITRGTAYAMNSTTATASYRGFTVTASNGESSLIYLLHPQCSEHAGMTDVLLRSENIKEPMDSCYIYLGGAYSTRSAK